MQFHIHTTFPWFFHPSCRLPIRVCFHFLSALFRRYAHARHRFHVSASCVRCPTCSHGRSMRSEPGPEFIHSSCISLVRWSIDRQRIRYPIGWCFLCPILLPSLIACLWPQFLFNSLSLSLLPIPTKVISLFQIYYSCVIFFI